MIGVAIKLSWPARELSPNGRFHYMRVHGAKKKARDEAYWAARAILPAGFRHNGGPTLVHVTFRPPDNRARDIDNAIASMKASLDGLAQALGCNDRLFVPTFHWAAPVSGGEVLVEVAI